MKNRGFTLIELMIVIAIVAIIAAIAIPSYNKQVEKSRRADGQSALLNAAQAMERCFTRTNTYVGCFTEATPGQPSQEGFYNVRATRLTATEYVLAATPTGPQTGDPCGTFTLDHLGVRGDDGGAADRCWGS